MAKKERSPLREGFFVPKFKLPAEGETLMPYLLEHLKRTGIYRPGLKVRIISKDRLERTLRTGTDRDTTSLVESHNGKYAGETLAMQENGLDPEKDVDKTTYVGDFDSFDGTSSKGEAILIYAPEALKALEPSERNPNSISNGFHMFTNQRVTKKALLAVFS